MKRSYVFLTLFICIFVKGIFAQNYVRLCDFNRCCSLEFVKKYLPSNPVIFEAGAYDGSHTLEFLKRWPQAKIFSFEPLPAGYEMLASRTKNFKNVSIYQMALSNKAGTATFYVSKDSKRPNNKGSSSSLMPPTQNYAIEFPQLSFDMQILVNTTTIDQWAQDNHIDHIDFMWLDMQGGEMPALSAAGEIIKTVRVVQTEVAFSEGYEGEITYPKVAEWFDRQGFALVAADCDINATQGEGNVLFVRKDVLAEFHDRDL